MNSAFRAVSDQPDTPENESRDAYSEALQSFGAELRRLRITQGNPSLRQIERRTQEHGARTSAASLSEMFNGKRLPRIDFLMAVVRALLSDNGADRREAIDRSDPRLLEWRERWRAVAALRASRGTHRDRVAASASTDPVHVPAGDADPVTAAPKGGGIGWPIRESDPFALEIHPPMAAADGAEALPSLPPYVDRPHDAQLRARLQRTVMHGHSTVAILIGNSSTGKTRAAWEAVQRLPASWRLWHPIAPTRPEALLKQLDQLSPNTVLWLNEAQHYLMDPHWGDRVAAALRAVVADRERAPVLVIGTLWPHYWRMLAAPPPPGQDDPHAHARELLTGTEVVVPHVFETADLENASALALRDPRLADALEHAPDRQVTQYLAGAPDLLRRYTIAPPEARAVLDAAIDLRRLGYGSALPARLLEEAAPHYLSDTAWDLLPDQWMQQALAYTCQPARGTAGPLIRVRARPGTPQTPEVRYRLADFLDQHGRTTRAAAPVPDGLWTAMERHGDFEYLPALASAARARGRFRAAHALLMKAADVGDPQALGAAARMLVDTGRRDEALAGLRVRADGGDGEAVGVAVDLLVESGRLGEAYAWCARAGDTEAMNAVAGTLAQAGQAPEAMTRMEHAAHAGDTTAFAATAALMEATGRTHEALPWWQRAAEAGNTEAQRSLTAALTANGQSEQALDWLKARAQEGDPTACGLIASVLESSGQSEQALPWYAKAADAGDRNAMTAAASLLRTTGRTEEAVAWYKRAADAGDLRAVSEVVSLLITANRQTEALQWAEARATTNGPDTLTPTAQAWEAAGHPEEALRWYRRASTAGDPAGLTAAARLLERTGRDREASELRRYGWDEPFDAMPPRREQKPSGPGR